MIQLIYVSSRSATFECVNRDPYYSNHPFSVLLNGRLVRENCLTNVFSIFDLAPRTVYDVQVESDIVKFQTMEEAGVVNIRAYGAKGDGLTLNTSRIQAAFFDAPSHGRVWIPPGTYLTGPLFLRSDLTIELAKGAILLGDPNRLHYPILPAYAGTESSACYLSSWEGLPNPTYSSLITGIGVHNVHLIGEGVIDENAQNGDWWIDHKQKKDGAYRAKGVFLSHCHDIHLQGLTIKNTPSWNLHPFLSKDLDFIDLSLISPKDSPNTDGCDPESCQNVRIIGVNFSVGDDCIAIKSGKYSPEMHDFPPSENITIRNCHMVYGHGAIVLGSEMSGGIRNLDVRQCLFEHTDRGLRIKTRRGRGHKAVIDHILFEDIRMDNVKTPLVLNMYYFCDDDGKTEYVYSKESLPVDERTPYLGSFRFHHIICTNVHAAAGFFYGLPEQPIERIELDQVQFRYHSHPKATIPAMMSFLDPMEHAGLIFHHVKEVILKGVVLDNPHGDPVILDHVENFCQV